MRTLVATTTLAFVLALAFVPAAQAQVPPQPTPSMTVAISGLPAQFSGLASNATAEAPFKVDVTLRNVVCPQAASVPVTITVSAAGAPAFFTVAADPESGAVNVPQGQFMASPASGSLDAKLVATLGEILANASVPVEVKAAASAPTGCSGAGSIPGAEASATIFANMTAPPPPPPPTPEDNDSPGPGALMGILAALGVAALRRRRSD